MVGMVGRIGRVAGQLCAFAVIGGFVVACGGQSTSSGQDEPGAGATGGSGGSGGTGDGSGGTGGGSGGTGGGSGGSDGGSGGTSGGSGGSGGGSGGTVSNDGCSMDGVYYEVGETFPAGDGCNTCTCQGSGKIGCTRTACVTCESVSASFEDAMLEAKRCSAGLDIIQCTDLVSSGLNCGCPTYVNTSDPVESLQEQWTTLDCGGDVTCGACPPTPTRGECAAEGINEGFCVDVFEEPPEPDPEDPCFSYLGDWILCEESGWPNAMQVAGATDLQDCMAVCLETPACTAVTDYFWLNRPDLGCWLHLATCDSPGPEVWAEEDGGKQYRKTCDP